ncbi:MAG: hypothetical protein RLZZ292_3310 [Bacteroidota bacterium]|jgi:uncharacterized membrane protein
MNSFIGLGKYLFAVPFAIFGLFHFMSAGDMATNMGVPGGVIAVYISGLAMLAAAVSAILGKYDKLAMVGLAILMVIYIAVIHLPLAMKGDHMAVGSILKDLALAGGALLYAGAYSKDASYIN